MVPSSFRILRQVLDRLEDSKTGRLLPESFHCARSPARGWSRPRHGRHPEGRGLQAPALGLRRRWRPGAADDTTDPVEVLLNRTWRPTCRSWAWTASRSLKNAGNVLRPTRPSSSVCACRRWWTAMRPRCSSRRCWRTTRLQRQSQLRARRPRRRLRRQGWNTPELAPWLSQALESASQDQFGAPAASSARAAPSR